MNHGDIDLAPLPAEQITICRADAVGWYVIHDNHIVACFRSVTEMAQWLEETFGDLDGRRANEPLPTVLQSDPGKPRRSMWHLLQGGKS